MPARDYGQAPTTHMLLVGPPATGKTMGEQLSETGETLHKGRQLVVHPDANGASGAPRCPPHAIAHQPFLTCCFFHSSADIGLSLMPYTASTLTLSSNMLR
jgi:hypothetical protein